MINDGVREAFHEYDKHRKKLLHYSRKRVKADRVCSINNNEIGNVRLRSLCPSIKMSHCFFFHFLARRVGPYRICVTSKNKIADQGSASYGVMVSNSHLETLIF